LLLRPFGTGVAEPTFASKTVRFSLEFATSARSRRLAVAASFMHAFHFAFRNGLVD
jgi:hypothetical protein